MAWVALTPQVPPKSLLHCKLSCLRKPIVQTIGCNDHSGKVSFALQAGIDLKYRHGGYEFSRGWQIVQRQLR